MPFSAWKIRTHIVHDLEMMLGCLQFGAAHRDLFGKVQPKLCQNHSSKRTN